MHPDQPSEIRLRGHLRLRQTTIDSLDAIQIGSDPEKVLDDVLLDQIIRDGLPIVSKIGTAMNDYGEVEVIIRRVDGGS